MANSVSQTVQSVVSSIEEGYENTQKVRESFVQVEADMDSIRESMQRIAASMEETTVGMRDIANSVESLEEIGNSNASSAKETLSKIVELVRSVESARKKLEELRG
jgi:methyl-accepting chemotaxis protein